MNTRIRSRIRGAHGFVSFATILVLGVVVVQIGLVAFVLSYGLTSSSAGVRFVSSAYAAAEAGIAEGIMRVLRNDYTNGAPFMVSGAGNATVSVTICEGETPSCDPDVSELNQNKTQIVSVGTVFGRNAIIIAIVEVDPVTSEVRIESVEEKSEL